MANHQCSWYLTDAAAEQRLSRLANRLARERSAIAEAGGHHGLPRLPASLAARVRAVQQSMRLYVEPTAKE